MWVNKRLFEMILADNKKQAEDLASGRAEMAKALASVQELRSQKAKDDLSIDWMRHRTNALEKERSIMMQKVAGVMLPVPEIVATRPGSMTVPDFSTMPSFEDPGDEEAKRLGAQHDDLGYLQFKEDHPTAVGEGR